MWFLSWCISLYCFEDVGVQGTWTEIYIGSSRVGLSVHVKGDLISVKACGGFLLCNKMTTKVTLVSSPRLCKRNIIVSRNVDYNFQRVSGFGRNNFLQEGLFLLYVLGTTSRNSFMLLLMRREAVGLLQMWFQAIKAYPIQSFPLHSLYILVLFEFRSVMCFGKDQAQSGDIGGPHAVSWLQSDWDQRCSATASKAGVLRGLRLWVQEGQAGMAKSAGCCGVWGEHCGNLWSSVFCVDEASSESLWVRSGCRSARVTVGAQYGQGMSEEQPMLFILTSIRLLTVSLVTSSSTNWWKYRHDKWTDRLKTGWAPGFEELWSAAWSPDGDQSLASEPRGLMRGSSTVWHLQ